VITVFKGVLMPFPEANADEEGEIGGPGRVRRTIAKGGNFIRNLLGSGPAKAAGNKKRR
jgi:hypothetical protein